VPALAIGFIAVAAISVVFERLLYSRLYRAPELDQVLFTIGLVFVMIAGVTLVVGPETQPLTLPPSMQGQISLGFMTYRTYSIVLIGVGVAMMLGLWLGFERTRMGAQIRAAVDNRRMAESVGINVDLLFTLTFAVGSGLAALGGGLAIQLFGLSPSFAVIYLVLFLIVVAVGGLGSLKGTLLAALVLGVFDTGGKYLLADAGGFFIYAVTVAVLLIKPAGFYGRE
jgi:branched-chain amino acid transport system permease protein